MAERKKTAVQETAEQEYVVLNRQAEEGIRRRGSTAWRSIPGTPDTNISTVKP